MTSSAASPASSASSASSPEPAPAPPQTRSCVLPLRWSDQDLNGHVNNARIVTLMEEARVQWLNRDAAADGVPGFSDPKVVASLNVEYLHPVEYGQELVMDLWISRIGSRSFTIAYRAVQDSTDCFTASTVLVPLDPAGRTSRALAPSERDYLARYHFPADAP